MGPSSSDEMTSSDAHFRLSSRTGGVGNADNSIVPGLNAPHPYQGFPGRVLTTATNGLPLSMSQKMRRSSRGAKNQHRLQHRNIAPVYAYFVCEVNHDPNQDLKEKGFTADSRLLRSVFSHYIEAVDFLHGHG
ncbi:hypothetical protein NUU61_007027 [Penicillium alfredii]|uniref:Protein kinase domain-containing protein n=1 Tax=Penicillium alfredii TaxID=1506179 RepID=A0A9W9F219_9EURO|nr:uncharacterized protein NUU61_007027 [Penicillium alfredii]KAJ5092157.1 hypothetical protein NUU61_007027 [Penicillium alfredii]